MEIAVKDTSKMVCVYLTRSDQEDQAVQQQVKELSQEYSRRNYLVAVFYSGRGSLYENTFDLLKYNRGKVVG